MTTAQTYTELWGLLRDVPAWTTTTDGNHVTRAAWLEITVAQVLAEYSELDALVHRITAAPQKTFSRSRILELIEEIRK